MSNNTNLTTTDLIHTASPTKLRDGSWGARVNGCTREGARIRIQTKAGKTWDAIVTKIVWEDRSKNVSIVATRSASPAPQRHPRHRDIDTGCPTGGDCWSFGHIRHCRSCGK